MIIFAMETSNDKAAAALVKVRGKKFKILSDVSSSQIGLHKKTKKDGERVPDVAIAKNDINILPFISQALIKAKIKPEKIDKIAVTTGPGLMSSLVEKIIFLT